MHQDAAKRALLTVVAAAMAACSESQGAQSASDAGADAAMAMHDAAMPVSDGAMPMHDGAATIDLDAIAFDADVPSIDAGVLAAVQGAPPPAPGMPGNFVLVGCPMAGQVEVVFYSVTWDGTKTAYGPYAGAYAVTGSHVSIVVRSMASSPLIDIEYDRTNSIAVAPFEYRATLTLDPSLPVTSQNYITRELNPAQPSVDDLGVLFSQTLVTCPGGS